MKRQVLLSVLVVAILAVSLGAPLASAQSEGASEPGLVIVRVDADGPAAAAGVKRGDILLAVDEQEINNAADWFRAMRTLAADETVTLQVLHGDDERTLTATVAGRNGRAYLGLQVYLGGAEDSAESEPLLLPLVKPALGAQVVEVVADSPASAAGLQPDDVITAVDGTSLDGDASLADIIGGYQPGDEVTLAVTRAGDGEEETLELVVTLGENPDDASRAFLGIRYTTALTTGDLEAPFIPFFEGQERQFRLPFGGQGAPFELPFDDGATPDGTVTAGAVVRTVAGDSPAADAGLEPGDLITAIDGEVVDGPQALVEAVSARQPGDVITLTVTRSGEDEAREIDVTLGENPDDAGKAYLGVSIGAFMMRFRGEMPGNRDGMRFQLPFGLGDLQFDPDQLPFDLDQLPFDLDQLPFDLPFELPGQQSDQPQA